MAKPDADPVAKRTESARHLGHMTLILGLASVVPWVIVITLPLTVAFAAITLVRSARLANRPGRSAALAGIMVAFVGLVVHLLIAGTAAAFGFLLGG